jgi:hypothetical protein
MAWQYYEIPTYSQYADHELSVSLGGVQYVLRLTYSARERAWYLSLYDADGTARYLGRKMVLGWPLMFRLPGRRVQYGELVCCGNDGVDVPYDRADLGDTFKLYYQTVST